MLVSLDGAEAVLVAQKWLSSGDNRIFKEPSHRWHPSCLCGEGWVGCWWKERGGLTSSTLWLSLLLIWFGAYEYEQVSAILVLTRLITYMTATFRAIFIYNDPLESYQSLVGLTDR
jgi:hypothetical protein